MKFEIEPHIGVGPIKLGMSRADVHAILGVPEYTHNEREGFLSGLMVDYDDNDCVEFIELANSNRFVAYFQDLPVHSTAADEIVSFLSQFTEYDKNDPELGRSFIFKDLQFSLWRSVLPEKDDDLDGRFFEAVGIAAKGYFP